MTNLIPINFPEGKIIEILGNVASGKTTTSLNIPKVSNFHYVDIDIYAQNPFLEDYVKDPKRWTFTSDLFFSFERSKQIELVAEAIGQNPVVLDSGFDMGMAVYAKSCFRQNKMTANEWTFFQNLHKSLMKDVPPLYTSIFIEVPIEILMSRIRKRGRFHEQDYTKEYLIQLQEGLDEYRENLIINKSRNVIVTYKELEKTHTFDKGQDEKISQILKKLEEMLPTEE